MGAYIGGKQTYEHPTLSNGAEAELYLTSTEVVSLMNFPDLAPYVPKITEVVEFATDMGGKLDNFQSGKTPYIDALLTDVITKQQEVRGLLEKITSLPQVPHAIILPLREIGTNLGLLKRVGHLFRENFRGEEA